MSTIYDPYFSTGRCIERMMGWYHKHGNLIVAFDYDDTVYDFWKKDFAYPDVISLLQECSDLGFTMILFTGHTDKDYETLKKDLADQGIRVDAINESTVKDEMFKKKVYCNILLDDKAGLGQAYDILRETVYRIQREKQQ